MSEMLIFSALGFGVVMFVLSVLSILTSTAGRFFSAFDKSAAKKAEAPKVQKVRDVSEIENPEHAFVVAAAVAAMMPQLKADNSELVAVLSAAATAALDDECRVVSVKLVPDMSYAHQGRVQLFASKSFTPIRAK